MSGKYNNKFVTVPTRKWKNNKDLADDYDIADNPANMAYKKNLKVLLVGHAGAEQAMLVRRLQHMPDYEVELLESPRDLHALQEIEKHSPQVVFLIHGYKFDALNFIIRFSRKVGEIPLLVLAMSGNERTAVEYMRAGAGDFLSRTDLEEKTISLAVKEALKRNTIIQREKRAKDAVRKNEASYRSLFQNSPIGILLTDRNGLVSKANITMLALMEKFSQGDSFPANILEYTPFKETGFSTNYRICIEHGELIQAECSLQDKDGRNVYLRYHLTPIFDYNRKVTHIQTLLEDITEQKNVESALQEAKRRQMEMLSNMQLLAIILDINGNIVFCNEFFLSLTGWKRDEIIGANWYARFLPGGDGKRKDLNALLNPQLLFYRNEILTKNGARHVIHWNNTILKDRDGAINGIASIGEDITNKLIAEQEIRNLSHSIIQVQEEERSRIAMEIHDDVGQTLFALKLRVQQALSRLNGKSLEKGEIPQAGKNKDETASILEMIDYIANYIRAFSHNLSPIGLKNLGLPKAITNLVDSYQFSDDDNPIHIHINIDDLDSFFPENWEINFYRIIQEALNNITKHAEATEVEILAHNPGNRLLVRLKDNGKGMNIDPSDDNRAHGIGLLIMRERANLMGARFSIKSSLNSGTEITIEIPKRNL